MQWRAHFRLKLAPAFAGLQTDFWFSLGFFASIVQPGFYEPPNSCAIWFMVFIPPEGFKSDLGLEFW